MSNFEIEQDESFCRSTVVVRFDIVTPIGDFHYDSGDRTVDEIRNIMRDLGLSSHIDCIGRLPNADIELSIHPRSDAD